MLLTPSKYDGTLKFWIDPHGILVPVTRLHADTIRSPECAERYEISFENTTGMTPVEKDRTERWNAVQHGFIRGIVRRDGHLTLEAGRGPSREAERAIISVSEYFNGITYNLLRRDSDEGLILTARMFSLSVPLNLHASARDGKIEGFLDTVRESLLAETLTRPQRQIPKKHG